MGKYERTKGDIASNETSDNLKIDKKNVVDETN